MAGAAETAAEAGAEAEAESEALAFPLPPAVEFWLQPAEELESCEDGALAAQARASLAWLQQALRIMHRSRRIKAAVSDLLNVSDFTHNLGVFGVFDELRAFCQEAANELGSEMKAYFEAAQLGRSLGSFHAKTVRSLPILRQDDPAVGVPKPPRQQGRTPIQQENVVLHMLILLARALDPGFQAILQTMASRSRGRHRAAPTKGHARMMNKAVSRDDHRFRKAPVVMHNIDLVRCAVTFDEVEDLKSMLDELEDTFGAPARDKNMFAYDDAEAAAQLHYRTFMRNFVYAPKGLTYGKLAAQNQAAWEKYLESRPEDPNEPRDRFRADSLRAVEFLRSDEIADRPVRLVCEVQCLLQKYLDGRLRMHGLYKVVRAPDEHALFSDFKKSCAADTEGKPWTIVQQQALEEVRWWVDEEKNDVNSPGEAGMTMLLSEAGRGHVWAVTWLLGRRADVDVATPDDDATPLHLAAENGHLDTVRVLLTSQASVDHATTSDGATPLSFAASRGDIDVVQLLLAARANPDAATSAGLTPLWRAAHGGHMDVVQVLLGARADVNQGRALDDCTPLFAASQSGYVDVAQALMAAGADVHSEKADDGVAPLSMAAFKGHASVVEALLCAGADANTATYEGATPLYVAAENGHVPVVEVLLAGSAATNQATVDDGTSPLYIAAQNGHTDVVQALLAGHADVDQATTDDGATPLWAAAEGGHAGIVQVLLDWHANMNQGLATDNSTPLFMAAYGGHASALRALLERSADIEHRGLFGTALEGARSQGHAEIVTLLEEADDP